MSLIDDALKRAQAAGQQEPQTGDRRWVPSPMPDAGLARRRRLLPVVLVAAAVAAAVSAAFLFLPRPGLRVPATATEPGPGEAKPATAAVAIALPTAAPTATTAEVRPTPAAPRPRATRPALVPDDTREQGETVVAPPPGVAPSTGVTAGRTYAGAVSLPGGAKIELGGIVWSETEPRALLNDRIAAQGAYVEGYTLTRIEQDRVALEKDGVTIFISVK